MAREINADFSELLAFFESYSLKDHIIKEEFKSLHKNYYCFLSFVYGVILSGEHKIPDQVIERMRETSSDLGTVILLLANGSYKPANLMSRSAIENFMKALAFMVDEKSLSEKSLFNLIDTAENFNMLTEKDLKDKFNQLKSYYGSLCAHVHTATIKEMEHISALNTLPRFDKVKHQSLSKIIINIVNAMLYIYIWIFRNAFFSLSEPLRSVVLTVMTKEQRRLIHQGRGQ